MRLDNRVTYLNSREYLHMLKNLVKLHPEWDAKKIAKEIGKSEYCIKLAMDKFWIDDITFKERLRKLPYGITTAEMSVALGVSEKEIDKAIREMYPNLNTPSSNGRTAAFGAVNRGSSPCGVTIVRDWKIKLKDKWNWRDFDKCTADVRRRVTLIEEDSYHDIADDDYWEHWK